MCGIAGLMTADGSRPADALLDRLSAAIIHRGPDGEGRHVEADTGLVQRRLAIIDLETGDQPLYAETESGACALVANGEIYNYVELRREIGEDSFRTRSDCELPVRLYADHGLEFAQRLRGMYAVAIHDPGRGRLVLARDPFGIKPLYYGETDDGFVFASEPQALIAAGAAEPVEEEVKRNELLQLRFTTGHDTIFRGIYRVLPGETIVVERGRVTQRIQVSALPPLPPRAIGREAALQELDRLLNDTVLVHQRADVPYGMFLSGGIDSSVLIALMRRLNARPVEAFTAGFSGTSVHDERAHARAVAEAAGANHHEVEFSADDFWLTLPRIAAAMDDPAADYAILPTWKLAETAHEHGLKVVLSGEGGDELFGGYGRYRRTMRSWLFGGRAMRTAGALDGLGVLREDGGGWRNGIAVAEADADRPDLTRLQRAQWTDCADWLPNDLLTKLDRCLMAHGVEGRTPFLDPEVADFAFRLPDRLKVHRRLGKWLLRKWLASGLPVAEPFARKRGFTVPVGEWISSEGARLGPLVARRPGVAAACVPGSVERLFRDGGRKQGQAQWILLFYALWHAHHIEGRPSNGGVFEVLGD